MKILTLTMLAFLSHIAVSEEINGFYTETSIYEMHYKKEELAGKKVEIFGYVDSLPSNINLLYISREHSNYGGLMSGIPFKGRTTEMHNSINSKCLGRWVKVRGEVVAVPEILRPYNYYIRVDYIFGLEMEDGKHCEVEHGRYSVN